jgi:hypothetical protein
MKESKPLTTNGLVMPSDFPTAEYEFVHSRMEPLSRTANEIYAHFAGAWNAVAYRFMAMTEYERAFSDSIAVVGASPSPLHREEQERALFGFFSSGFSVFESTFYALFSMGAFLSGQYFPIATQKDQQRISPATTAASLAKAFSNDPLMPVVTAILLDPAYLEWREIRNILTHRAAPGRTFFVGIGGDDELPDQWKIKNIPLDKSMAPKRREELSRLLSVLIGDIEAFTERHF